MASELRFLLFVLVEPVLLLRKPLLSRQKRLFLVLADHVFVQISRLSEGSVANLALKRSLAGVGPRVVKHIAQFLKRLNAVTALKSDQLFLVGRLVGFGDREMFTFLQFFKLDGIGHVFIALDWFELFELPRFLD